ncbi:MAG: dTDP-4-dehydrorhamnose reductase [Candidatus Hydrogenedentes bacterium]|nr:dTDP-4-dehydrorhamnose reductase [Candidatus Hydrogenedentota bacterium]
MKIVVIGGDGQLGVEICRVYTAAGHDVRGLTQEDLEVRHATRVWQRITGELTPDLVINTAAAHDLPECERRPDWAFSVNANGARNVALACQARGVPLVHLSTDYVFGGDHDRPYAETDLPRPLSVYGASKLAGEHLVAAECERHFIVRTAALYGPTPCKGKNSPNFVQLMLRLARTQPEVRVVTDEVTTPTYTVALAQQIKLLAEKSRPGLYHATCQGQCSWYEFAQTIFEETKTHTTLVQTTSKTFQSTVKRPNYSVLDNYNLRNQELDIMPTWQEALKEYLRLPARQ